MHRPRKKKSSLFTDARHTDSIRYQASPRISEKGIKAKAKENVQVDRWKLGEKLGAGAFSVVYKGLDVTIGEFVAVKRITLSPAAEETLKKEWDILKNLRHPHIVKYIDLVCTDNHVNLVLEFVEGGSLSDVVQKFGVFPPSLTVIYLYQVLEGLNYLHQSDVVHRDIKGPNILITKNGTVKVADFGIAQTSKISESTSIVDGSPFWMAPELIQVQPSGTACDIWSLGCTAIELLVGYPPYFDCPAMTALFRMVEDPHPPFPEEAEKDINIKNFLEMTFIREPTKRPTALELLEKNEWISTGKTERTADLQNTIESVKEHNTQRKKSTLRKIKNLKSVDWNQESESKNNNDTNGSITSAQLFNIDLSNIEFTLDHHSSPVKKDKKTKKGKKSYDSHKKKEKKNINNENNNKNENQNSTNNQTNKNENHINKNENENNNSKKNEDKNSKNKNEDKNENNNNNDKNNNNQTSINNPVNSNIEQTAEKSEVEIKEITNLNLKLTKSPEPERHFFFKPENLELLNEVEYFLMVSDKIEVRRNFWYTYPVFYIGVYITYPEEKKRNWAVWKSLSEIQELDFNIKTKKITKSQLPKLPKEKLDISAPEIQDYFIHELRIYFSALTNDPDIYQSSTLCKFLEDKRDFSLSASISKLFY